MIGLNYKLNDGKAKTFEEEKITNKWEIFYPVKTCEALSKILQT